MCCVPSTDQKNSWIFRCKPWIWGLCNNPQIGYTILGWYVTRCPKHGLLTDPWIATKKVWKVWIKVNPPKTNQEKESGVLSSENRTCRGSSAQLSLEGLQTKRTSFPLPGSFFWCFAPDLCGKDGFPSSIKFFIIGHWLSAYVWTHLVSVWASI